MTVAFESEGGAVAVCEKGAALNFDEELAKKVLTENEVTIQIDVHEGDARCHGLGLRSDV